MRRILRNSFLGEPNRSSTNRSRRCHERDGKELSTDRCRTCIPINVLWPVNGIRDDESSHHCWKPTRSSLRTASFLEFHKPRAVTISWYPCRCSSFARVFSDFPRPSVLESCPTVFKWHHDVVYHNSWRARAWSRDQIVASLLTPSTRWLTRITSGSLQAFQRRCKIASCFSCLAAEWTLHVKKRLRYFATLPTALVHPMSCAIEK